MIEGASKTTLKQGVLRIAVESFIDVIVRESYRKEISYDATAITDAPSIYSLFCSMGYHNRTRCDL